jgi:hypothetical protein
MRRTAVLLACLLPLTACSAGSDPAPAVTVTATKSPSLSAADARAACVDAWLAVLENTPDDAPDVADKPAVCEGQAGQATMYAEALQTRNQANRDELDACLEDPECTGWPVP